MSVVTGEAVALDLRVARAGSRALAFVIDGAVVAAVLVAWTILWSQLLSARVSQTDGDTALAAAVLLVIVVGTLVGYPVVLETTTRGRTLGKMALGLRVVRDDGGPIRFRQAFVRGLVGMFELYALSGIPAVVSSLASGSGKRVGDYLAGTVVLQERVPGRAAPMPLMPPPLAGWAATADLSAVNDALALAVRQYLGRAQELAPVARAEMEARLAAAVGAAVAPPPPPGTPAWALLAAVAAERRQRAEQQLQRSAPPGRGTAPPPPTAAPPPPTAAPPADPPPADPPPADPPPGGFAPPS